MRLPNKAKIARVMRGWTQQELAERAHVALGDVSRIESGRMIPYPAQAERLARVLGLQPDELQQPADSQQQEAIA